MPSACTIVLISPDFPKTGSAHNSLPCRRSRTRMKSVRPCTEATLRRNRAVIETSADFGSHWPPMCRRKGRVIRVNTIIADTMWPGSPQIALQPTRANMAGFPGLIAIPCTKISEPENAEIASTVQSRTPTELPPEMSTMSQHSKARAHAA